MTNICVLVLFSSIVALSNCALKTQNKEDLGKRDDK